MSNIHLGRHDSARASSTALEGERTMVNGCHLPDKRSTSNCTKYSDMRAFIYFHIFFYHFKTKPKDPRVIQTKQRFYVFYLTNRLM